MGPAHGDVLRIVGIVLSVHIAGMYALSPVTGWLTDRFGRRPVDPGGASALLRGCRARSPGRPGTTPYG